MTADIGLSEAGCTTAVTLSQLVQSSSENDIQPGDRWRVRETAVFWALGVATGCRQCEPAVTQVEPGSADCKLGCNQRESGAGFSGSESELGSGLIASWGV